MHVQQEIVGDDRSALQSVIDSDQERRASYFINVRRRY